jgi:proteic killer suppression protein
MIRSWRNSAARKVWDGEQPNQFRGLDFEAAIDLLLALNIAKSLSDLSPLKVWACTSSKAIDEDNGR